LETLVVEEAVLRRGYTPNLPRIKKPTSNKIRVSLSQLPDIFALMLSVNVSIEGKFVKRQ